MERKTESKARAGSSGRTQMPMMEALKDTAEMWATQWGTDPFVFLRLSQKTLHKANGKLLSDAVNLIEELMNLGKARATEDMACASKIMTCRTREDVEKLQQEWLRTAFENYRASGTAITEKYMDLIKDGLQIAADSVNATLSSSNADKS